MLGEARTRILIWYLALMFLSSMVSIIAVRQILITRLEETFQQSLQQEIEEFKKLLGENNPSTGNPFGDDVEAIFDVFLSRNIPEDDEFLLAIVDGQFYSASSLALPASLQRDGFLMQRWMHVKQPQQGIEVVPDTLAQWDDDTLQIYYWAEPVMLNKRTGSVFIVARIANGEKAEINDAIRVMTKVSLVVLTLASLLAWFVAGKVLAPLRLLSQTARSISESNLTERIPVRGRGDIAQLTVTFNDMMDRLEATFKSQRQLLNDVGHELRTPITIIRGHLELMGSTPEAQEETLDIVLDELDRISRFINELMLLAKSQRPDFLQPEILSLDSFTHGVFAKITTLADRQWQLESVGFGQFAADRQRLTEAMINLAQNATQHTDPGDIIALGSAQAKNTIRVWVRDTGEGIDPSDQRRIFDRFVRGQSRYRRSEGAGLGLAIVQAIAQAHGGYIDLKSQPQQGSTFTLIIPLQTPKE